MTRQYSVRIALLFLIILAWWLLDNKNALLSTDSKSKAAHVDINPDETDLTAADTLGSVRTVQNGSEGTSIRVNRALGALTVQFQDIERANSSYIEKVIYPEGEKLYIQLRPPTQEQLEKMYGELSASTEALGDSLNERREFRERATILLNEFANFPKRLRVISLGFNKSSKMANFSSRFVDSVEDALPNEQGVIIDRADGSLKLDWNWNKGNSWARPRFEHLLAIDEKDGSVSTSSEN